MALHRRDTAELLSEELRLLDPDEVYAETIAPFVPRHRPRSKRNGGSSRKRATASADTSRKAGGAPQRPRR